MNLLLSPRVLPFALFMSFIGVEELIRLLMDQGILDLSATDLLFLYPIKALVVGATLVVCLPKIGELRLRDLARLRDTALSVALGLVVFVLWINMDWSFGPQGEAPGFNPSMIEGEAARLGLILSRLAGAVLVVPIMEEVFWRSFLLRYVIRPDFETLPVGIFNWTSFLVVTVLFASAHTLILAGIMAGAAYAGLLYLTRSVAQCSLSHAVTNLALGLWVLSTGNWRFW